MTSDSRKRGTTPRHSPGESGSGGVRRSVWLLVGAAALTTALAALLSPGAKRGMERGAPPAAAKTPAPEDRSEPHAPLVGAARSAIGGGEVSIQARTIAAPVPTPPAPEPSATARALVSGVVNLPAPDGNLTEAQALAWKENLQRLIEQGPDGVRAIKEFLARNTEIPFGEAGCKALGYPSARTALIGALVQAGGPEAVGALSATLATTGDPWEIALLAQGLDKLDPAQHRQEALTAAGEVLAEAADPKYSGLDVAPLFEVFQHYGDASVVPDLERYAKQWGYYAVTALAQLPDQAGIPALLQIATGSQWSSGARDAAWEMVAQVAAQSPDARAALLEQVRQNKLSAFNWASMSPLLAGDQIHFRNSALDVPPAAVESASTVSAGQSLFAAPTTESLATERLNQQIALIDELLGATSDPASAQALQQARALAMRRLSQVATLNATSTPQ